MEGHVFFWRYEDDSFFLSFFGTIGSNWKMLHFRVIFLFVFGTEHYSIILCYEISSSSENRDRSSYLVGVEGFTSEHGINCLLRIQLRKIACYFAVVVRSWMRVQNKKKDKKKTIISSARKLLSPLKHSINMAWKFPAIIAIVVNRYCKLRLCSQSIAATL